MKSRKKRKGGWVKESVLRHLYENETFELDPRTRGSLQMSCCEIFCRAEHSSDTRDYVLKKDISQ